MLTTKTPKISQKTLKFEFITDSRGDKRDNTNYKETMKDYLDKFRQLCQDDNNVIVIAIDEPRLLTWEAHADNEESYQQRTQILLQKTSNITWNDVYKLINSVKACYYSFALPIN